MRASEPETLEASRAWPLPDRLLLFPYPIDSDSWTKLLQRLSSQLLPSKGGGCLNNSRRVELGLLHNHRSRSGFANLSGCRWEAGIRESGVTACSCICVEDVTDAGN